MALPTEVFFLPNDFEVSAEVCALLRARDIIPAVTSPDARCAQGWAGIAVAGSCA